MSQVSQMKTTPDKYGEDYRKKQADYGKKGKKVGKGYFWQLKNSGKPEDLEKLKELAKRGRASQ